jgi:hypothetical protein
VYVDVPRKAPSLEIQRLMVDRETPKSSATSFLGMPRSIAASVFSLRSFEYAFMDPIFV